MNDSTSGTGTFQNRLKARLAIPEVRVALALTLIISLFAGDFGIFSSGPVRGHLGGEYFNIAMALVSGRGYADPFGAMTGPTAWMPPFLPALLALMLNVLRTREAVANALLALNVGALVCVGVLVYRIAKERSTRLSPRRAVELYVLWLWSFNEWFFGMTHDVCLLTLLVGLLVWVLHRYTLTDHVESSVWIGAGAVAVLASPAIATSWFIVNALLWLKSTSQRRRLSMAGVIVTICATAWLARNAVVFGEFVPVKSNLFYEAYQANFADEDGIYDGTFQDHPFNSRRARLHYAELGETNYVTEYKTRFLRELELDPSRYAQNVARRALAVTVWHVPSKYIRDPLALKAFRQLLYALPFLGIILCYGLKNPWRGFVSLLLVFCLVYLIPYVLVGFYLRYMMPLTPMLVLFVFFGINAC